MESFSRSAVIMCFDDDVCNSWVILPISTAILPTSNYQQWIKPNSSVTSLHNVSRRWFWSQITEINNQMLANGKWRAKNEKSERTKKFFHLWKYMTVDVNAQPRIECSIWVKTEREPNLFPCEGIGNCMLNSKQCLWSTDIWEYDRYHANSILYYFFLRTYTIHFGGTYFWGSFGWFFHVKLFCFFEMFFKKIKHSSHSS